MKVLVVEDHFPLAESLLRGLTAEGFQATVARNLAEARVRLESNPDIVVLDWMLPDGQGLDLLREVRRRDERLPIVLLTARTELVDKVVGLEAGANDYLTKPFETRELIARLRAHLRTARAGGPTPVESDLICVGALVIDTERMDVRYAERAVELTRMEYELVKLLAKHPNRVFPREALLNQVWGYDCYPTTRTVDNHIAQLRAKLSPDLFEAVRGVGYRLRNDGEGTKR